jgi:hypothetical protein
VVVMMVFEYCDVPVAPLAPVHTTWKRIVPAGSVAPAVNVVIPDATATVDV